MRGGFGKVSDGKVSNLDLIQLTDTICLEILY